MKKRISSLSRWVVPSFHAYCTDLLKKLLERLEDREGKMCEETNDEHATGNETNLPLSNLERKL